MFAVDDDEEIEESTVMHPANASESAGDNSIDTDDLVVPSV